MKKALLGALAGTFICSASLHAQEGCGTGRYNTEIFSNYTLTSDVEYGNNPQGAGSLKLDIYQPTGDSINERPLIILVHGGSFIAGNKTDDNAVTDNCKAFAKMGFVTASIQYSLGFDVFPPNPQSAARTVYRAARELKTAVRFFRKDAATANTYKINPDMVFIGGNSAGAITALHAAYLDQYSELPAGIDTSSLSQGNIEGSFIGNAGYSSKVTGVINMAGAIGDTTWMMNNLGIPVVSAHGDADGTVPYGSQTIVFGGVVPIMPVDGSGSIDEFTDNHNMLADLLTFPGDDHCPWNSNPAKMTQVINHNRDFLYPIICSNAGITAPQTDFSANATTVGMGQSVYFTQNALNNPTTFTWNITPATHAYISSTGTYTPNPIVTFSAPGQYTVTLTATNAAGSDGETKTSYITVYDNTSIKEQDGNATISVYPNPATDVVYVQLTQTTGTVTYKVIDVTGKTVLSGNQAAQNGLLTLDTQTLAGGVYTIQLQAAQVVKTAKVIKK